MEIKQILERDNKSNFIIILDGTRGYFKYVRKNGGQWFTSTGLSILSKRSFLERMYFRYMRAGHGYPEKMVHEATVQRIKELCSTLSDVDDFCRILCDEEITVTFAEGRRYWSLIKGRTNE